MDAGDASLDGLSVPTNIPNKTTTAPVEVDIAGDSSKAIRAHVDAAMVYTGVNKATFDLRRKGQRGHQECHIPAI